MTECSAAVFVRSTFQNQILPKSRCAEIYTSYLGVFDVAKSTYFMDLDVEYEDMCLADSAGMPIAIADTEKWTVGSFYESNALQPSRYKLYVMLKEIVYLLLCS